MEHKYFSNSFLYDTVRRATPAERTNLAELFPSLNPSTATPAAICQSISHAGGHALANILREGKGVSYAEILSDIATHLRIPGHVGIYAPQTNGIPCFALIDRIKAPEGRRYSVDQRFNIVQSHVAALEKSILGYVLQNLYAGASETSRAILDGKIAEIVARSGDSSLKGLTGGAALLAIANASGFALYTTASTVLSTLSAGTLGFGAYTATSSIISIIIGPVGWLALGAYGAYEVGLPKKNRLLQIGLSCALIAQRIRDSEASAR